MTIQVYLFFPLILERPDFCSYIAIDTNLLAPLIFHSINEKLYFAAENGFYGVVIRCPSSKWLISLLGDILAQKLLDSSFKLVIYIEVPVSVKSEQYYSINLDEKNNNYDNNNINNYNKNELIYDPWIMWNELRSILPPSNLLCLCLELDSDIPTNGENERWAGEPVRLVKLTTKAFHNGSIKILDTHKDFLFPIVTKSNVKFTFASSTELDAGEILKIAKYIKNELYPFYQKFLSESTYWNTTYDQLKNPLQPLRDDLEIKTYDVFEEDPIKYKLYNDAIYEALIDIVENYTFFTNDEDSSDSGNYSYSSENSESRTYAEVVAGSTCQKEIITLPAETITLPAAPTPLTKSYEKCWITYKQHHPNVISKSRETKIKSMASKLSHLVIFVVGAGKGPLVTASLKAAQQVGLSSVTIHIVEKNPNVQETLKKNVLFDWPKQYPFAKLFLHHVDMRNLNCSVKADLVVSELLGSFGCNELSPECLDGISNILKANTICIPQSYTSHLHPIMSSKLYRKTFEWHDALAHEYNYVVNMKSYYAPCPTKKVFRFSHVQPKPLPKLDNNAHNKANVVLTFDNRIDYVCHGFAGYFTSRLYKSNKLSIRPQDHTKDLISWFPMYFPLIEPILVKANQGLTMEMKRETDGVSVWYEFRVISPFQTIIHNQNGRAHPIIL